MRMKKSRVSMVIAAGGLILVGLLAAALFSPAEVESPAEETDETSKADKTVKASTLPTLADSLGIGTAKPEDVRAAKEPRPEPKAVPTPEPKKGGVIEYKIKSGDVISKIAVRFGCKSSDIYKLNDGLNAKTALKIRPGQIIKVPTGKAGAAAVAQATKKSGIKPDYWPDRVVTADPGDTAFDLAIEYYGARNMFRHIMKANPDLPWQDRLSGGETVKLPAWGTNPDPKVEKTGAKPVVKRDGVIPPRR